MIRNILNTLFIRSFNAGLAFLIVILTARLLGAEVRGQISIFVLNVTLIFQVMSIFGGSSLVYYSPRRKLLPLINTNIAWSLIAVPLVVVILYYLGFVQTGHVPILLVTGFVLSWYMSGLNILLGFEKIKSYNFLTLVQMLILTVLFVGFIFLKKFDGFEKWFWAYFISILVALAGVAGIVMKIIKWHSPGIKWVDVRDMFNYGKWTQGAYFIQLLNYRIGFYILFHFWGNATVGVYSTAAAIAESIWLISKSISMVLFARIVNLKDQDESLKLTILYGRLSFYFSLVFVALLLLLPDVFYTWLFGNEFIGIKRLLILLIPGILLFSITTVYGHYFSGIGRPKINSFTSIIGLVFTLIFGFALIPVYGRNGVAVTASLSFIASGIFVTIQIIREPGVTFTMLLPKKSDIAKTRMFITSLIGKK